LKLRNVSYEDNSLELYDIKQDVGEKNNLATTKKSIAKRYKKALDKWLADNHAKFPVNNPAFKASATKKGAANEGE
jgi:hypothetical protein